MRVRKTRGMINNSIARGINFYIVILLEMVICWNIPAVSIATWAVWLLHPWSFPPAAILTPSCFSLWVRCRSYSFILSPFPLTSILTPSCLSFSSRCRSYSLPSRCHSYSFMLGLCILDAILTPSLESVTVNKKEKIHLKLMQWFSYCIESRIYLKKRSLSY